MKIIITSGPTRAYIDDIRYISNYSTGELGTKIAQKVSNGNKVIFIYGKGSRVPKGRNIKFFEIETVSELIKAVKKEAKSADVFIHAMAVLDYEPKKILKGKVKSDKKSWKINLTRTPKVIRMVKKINPKIFLIGFKLESKTGKEKLLNSAYRLMKECNADIIVANELGSVKKGVHEAHILSNKGYILSGIKGKDNIANSITAILKSIR